MTATTLIIRSEKHNELVTHEWNQQLHDELYSLCSDCGDTNEGVEFWGSDPECEDSMEWRIHLVTQ